MSRPPTVEDGPFRMLGTILEANPYLGRIVTGRISSGAVKPNQMVKVLDRDGKLVEEGPRDQGAGLPRAGAHRRRGRRRPATSSRIAGLPEATVSHTICAPEVTAAARAADRSADAWR